VRRFIAIPVLLLFIPNLYSYSVLTHQAIIDTAWNDAIQPLLRQRFPQATANDLKSAHAYAYGGCIIQDVGYYPFGSHLFTDLTHYVRSGDFVAAMLSEAKNIHEYAFGLGALAHYAADTKGHPAGINRAVPILYPKLQQKYGDEITYVEDPASHIQTEFGFDVLQVAKGRYAPDAYHDFIDFEVSKPVLESAFRHTYGLELNDVFGALDLAIGTYRKTVSGLVPKMTEVAWQMKKEEILKSQEGMTPDKFIYNLSAQDYEKEWGTEYRKPGIGTRLLAFVIRIVPKIGPLRAVSFHAPTPESEKIFADSFNATIERYRSLIEAERTREARPPDLNLDNGEPAVAGSYKLADDAYAEIVNEFAKRNFDGIPIELRMNILEFYKNLDAPIVTKKNPKRWARLQQQLERLR
jgi:hypothetical protein